MQASMKKRNPQGERSTVPFCGQLAHFMRYIVKVLFHIIVLSGF
jgi:hypothetical protein